MGVTWALHGQCPAADCDRGCAPAAYRPRHAVTSRWPARLAIARAHARRLGRNALAVLADAWPGFARGPSLNSASYSRLRASARTRPAPRLGPDGSIVPTPGNLPVV